MKIISLTPTDILRLVPMNFTPEWRLRTFYRWYKKWRLRTFYRRYPCIFYQKDDCGYITVGTHAFYTKIRTADILPMVHMHFTPKWRQRTFYRSYPCITHQNAIKLIVASTAALPRRTRRWLPECIIDTANWAVNVTVYCTVNRSSLHCGQQFIARWTAVQCTVNSSSLHCEQQFIALWTAVHCTVNSSSLHCEQQFFALWTAVHCTVNSSSLHGEQQSLHCEQQSIELWTSLLHCE